MVVKINRYEKNEIIKWKWASDNELIPTPFYTSCYFIDGILIDSGAPASVDEFKNFIKPLTSNYDIKCILTHSHEDHCGGAHLLQEQFQIPIYAHNKAIPDLKEEYNYPKYRQMTWGKKRLPVEAEEVPNIVVSDSEKYSFKIFPMPGHAPDQFALIEEDQEWAFVADAVQPTYRMLFGESSDIQEDIKIIYDSIKNLYKKTEGMNNLKIYPSSKGVFIGRHFLKEKLEEIENLHQKVHQKYEELSKDYEREDRLMRKVLRGTLGRESAVGKLTRGDLSKMNLVKSLLRWSLKSN